MTIWHLPVYRHDAGPARSKLLGLYEKETPTEGTPAVGDMMTLWPDGGEVDVTGRHWDEHGRLNVSLQRITWLPSEDGQAWIEASIRYASVPGKPSATIGWTDSDEETMPLVVGLEAGRWQAESVNYNDWRDVRGEQ